MRGQGTTMFGALKALIAIYLVVGVAYTIDRVGGALQTASVRPSPAWLIAVVGLALAFGLNGRKPWAHVLGLFVGACLMVLGVFGLALGVALLLGLARVSTGLFVTRPFLGMGLSVLVFAFGAWQFWVLTRPALRGWFRPGRGRGRGQTGTPTG